LTKIRIDIYAWIPLPDVPNPLFLAGKLNARLAEALGPGASGPRFGGDDFQYPPKSQAGWAGGPTYRAMQTVEFAFDTFGAAPVIVTDAGVQTGLTTVLNRERRAGGTVIHSLKASVMRSPPATVSWSADNGWYELAFAGAAQDPVPADVARQLGGAMSGQIASLLVPNLSWDICLRIQKTDQIPALAKARYVLSSSLSMDSSNQLQTSGRSDPYNGFVHGLVGVTQFPSYVMYITYSGDGGVSSEQIGYFSDASSRMGALGRILIAQTDVLKPVYF
jgi:hypothetical protein